MRLMMFGCGALAWLLPGVASAAPTVSACNTADLTTLGLTAFDTATTHANTLSQPIPGEFLLSMSVPKPTSGFTSMTYLVDGVNKGEYIVGTIDTIATMPPTALACTVIAQNTAGDLDYLEIHGTDLLTEEFFVGGYSASWPHASHQVPGTFSGLNGGGTEDDYLNVGIFGHKGFDYIQSPSNTYAATKNQVGTTDVAYYFSGGASHDHVGGTDNFDCILGDEAYSFEQILSGTICTNCDGASEILRDAFLDRQVLCWPKGPGASSDGNDFIHGNMFDTGSHGSSDADTNGDLIAGGGGNDMIQADFCTPPGNGYGHEGSDLIFGDYGFFGVWIDRLDVFATMDAGASGNDEIRGGCLDKFSGTTPALPTQAGIGVVGDVIAGGPGDDEIFGSAAQDTIYGEWQDDVNADIIAGGYNTLTTNVSDEIYGVGAKDTIYTGPGPNIALGGKGADTIHGGAQTDVIWGEGSNDVVYAKGGIDIVIGGAGSDLIQGNAQDDLICGGSGSDWVLGNENADVLYGDFGVDPDTTVGHNPNLLRFWAAMPVPLLEWGCEPGASKPSYIFGNYDLVPDTGADAGDIMGGGTHADVMIGGGGGDTMNGWTGADVMVGGDGADTIRGEAGADVIGGNDGGDELRGADGDDTICDADAGDDLYGGNQDDTLWIQSGVTPIGITGGNGPDTCADTPTTNTSTCGTIVTSMPLPSKCLAANNAGNMDISP